MDNLGLNYIDTIQALDFQMKYNWTFRVSSIPDTEDIGDVVSSIGDGINNFVDSFSSNPIKALGNAVGGISSVLNSELVNAIFTVKSVTLPFIKLETETQKSGNKIYKGYTDFDNFEIEIMETTSFATKKFFSDWQNSTFDSVNRVFNKKPPLKTCILTLDRPQQLSSKSGTFLNVPSVMYTFKKVKILGVEPLSLDYSSGEPLSWNVSMTCDAITEQFMTVPIPF